MKILVTGGAGLVGRPLVERLLDHGHAVRILDLSTQSDLSGVETIAADVTDFASVREALRGMEAVVHLAALTHPSAASAPEIFRVNSTGTFNIYEAAAQEGIRRVICASSINALGFNFGVKGFPIEYLPVDEDHPTFTSDAYSFSKCLTEEIGAYYWRREGISGVQLRLPGVIPMTPEFQAMVAQFIPVIRMAYAQLQEMSLDARQKRARQLVAENDEQRGLRLHEVPQNYELLEGDWSPDLSDPLGLIAFGLTDFWTMISTKNSAHAFERGISAEYQGSHPLFVADPTNMLGLDAEWLASTFYPDAARKRALAGDEPLVSSDKARQLIGYQPESSVGLVNV